MSSSEVPPNCIDRFVAAVTADIVAARNPLSYMERYCIMKNDINIIHSHVKHNIQTSIYTYLLTPFPMPQLRQ